MSHWSEIPIGEALGFGPPVPVFQDGQQVGTLPPGFNPQEIRSTSWLYEPRPGDFKREEHGWVADKMLGPGDLEAISGFTKLASG